MIENTKDLSEFGFRELKEAGLLLTLYKSDKDKSELSEKISIEFNPNSGNVFLVDEDYNVAMEWNGELVNWLNCPECGYENYLPEYLKESINQCCKNYFKEFTNV